MRSASAPPTLLHGFALNSTPLPLSSFSLPSHRSDGGVEEFADELLGAGSGGTVVIDAFAITPGPAQQGFVSADGGAADVDQRRGAAAADASSCAIACSMCA